VPFRVAGRLVVVNTRIGLGTEVFRRTALKSLDERPEESRVYRYEVEIVDLPSGSSRRIALQSIRLVCLPRKKGQVVEPPVDVLRFRDGDFEIEARSFEEFRERLRAQYPDDQYERRLHMWRDREAEERHEKALEELAGIFARAMVDEFMKSQECKNVEV
jgi:hypothetical protein